MAQYRTQVRGKPEDSFRVMIQINMPKHRGKYVVIPDEKILKERLKRRKDGKGNTIAAAPRPYDGNMIFINNTITVELKADNNKLLPHQKALGEELENLCDRATGERPQRLVWCLLRRNRLVGGDVYTVENTRYEVYYKTNDINDLLGWLRNHSHEDLLNKNEKNLDNQE